jgi:hypothetical protein
MIFPELLMQGFSELMTEESMQVQRIPGNM